MLCTYNRSLAFKKCVFQLMTFFGYSVIMTFQTISRQYFFLNIWNETCFFFRFSISKKCVCVDVSNNLVFQYKYKIYLLFYSNHYQVDTFSIELEFQHTVIYRLTVLLLQNMTTAFYTINLFIDNSPKPTIVVTYKPFMKFPISHL